MPTRQLQFVAFALLGTAVGTLAALMLAPESGPSRRRSLRNQTGELLSQLPSQLEDWRYRLLAPRPGRIDASFVQLYRECGG
ncbi:MAG: YtxH domain-containing protein [Cyanobacteria bacterium REEB65]|nr:YtxH domain-containing protein [Cyanobacteria bacterium REEB65]